jgi:hypothetical protein
MRFVGGKRFLFRRVKMVLNVEPRPRSHIDIGSAHERSKS